MEKTTIIYMGGCQNDGLFSGTLNIRCRIIIGIPKGTIILTTTHIQILMEYNGVSKRCSSKGWRFLAALLL